MRQFLIVSFLLGYLLACKEEAPTQILSTPKAKDTLSTGFSLTDIQAMQAGVALGQITQKPMDRTIKVNGKIDIPPQNIISISGPLGGYLKQTRLLPGSFVRKGEVLALMEDPSYIDLQQQYLMAQNQLTVLEKEYLRQQNLNAHQATSDKSFEIIQSEYLNQKVLLKALSEKLKLIFIQSDTLREHNLSKTIRILSPINGFVSKINANIGKYLGMSDVLLELIHLGDIHLTLNVYEKDVEGIFVGQKGVAFSNNEQNVKHPFRIILVNKNIGTEGNFEAHCHFDKENTKLVPGMYMNAVLESPSRLVATLPSDAVVRYENKHYVFLSKGSSRWVMQEVEIGDTKDTDTEIKVKQEEWLRDSFVVKGAYALLMKLTNQAE